MINRDFWVKVAEKWSAKSDGIVIPDIGEISDDLGLEDEFDDITDEIEDILADIEI